MKWIPATLTHQHVVDQCTLTGKSGTASVLMERAADLQRVDDVSQDAGCWPQVSDRQTAAIHRTGL
jgi:hypothetical protein